jgi:signal peptidase I
MSWASFPLPASWTSCGVCCEAGLLRPTRLWPPAPAAFLLRGKPQSAACPWGSHSCDFRHLRMRLDAREFLSLSQEILSKGHGVRFQALGSSMFPSIRHGNIIRLARVEISGLRPGDVIAFRRGKALVVHRLVRKDLVAGRTTLMTRGDAWPWQDLEPVAPEQVLGRLTAIEWHPGRQLEVEAGLGRALWALGAKISPLIARICRALARMNREVCQAIPLRTRPEPRRK